ncbi:MAG: hypothetical protein A3H91_08825 [Gammaproteobacteria bacterium RIFCSPLOWO2_02_FULL_61_13]|nr:MAG: hypothetical protein A3H91_08825 [Gammaproteobacteria bacterium RIFCSPLOWO2_02_FULL_61_13]
MRWVALCLLALNLVHYGWQVDADTRTARANQSEALTLPARVGELKLLRELAQLPAAREELEGQLDFEPAAQAVNDPGLQTETSVPAEIQAGTGAGPDELVNQLPDLDLPGTASGAGVAGVEEYSCFSFGPLPEEKHAIWLADWFRVRLIPLRSRVGEDADRSLFWVYLSPQQSRQGVDSVLDTLAKKGIQDYRLIDRGNLANAVSLGLFSSQSQVNERLRQLREQGFQPVVVPYPNVQRIHWVDVRLPKEDPVLQEMYTGFPSRFGSVPVACSEIALDQSAP